MSEYWRDKVVLITGGSSGLGYALTEAFLAAHAKVVIVGRDLAKLQAAADSLGERGDVLPVAADVTSDEAVARAIDQTLAHFGRLDCLVNNAGRSSRGALLETSLAEYRSQWELNFLALVRCTQAAAPHLLAARGHVINIGSLAAKAPGRFMGPYASTKFAVAAFSQQLRMELADTGLKVLLVCPGPIQRTETTPRYQADNVPASANQPGGGVKLKGIPPAVLASKVLRAAERGDRELIVPFKAKLLFALAQLSPRLGDWILRRMT